MQLKEIIILLCQYFSCFFMPYNGQYQHILQTNQIDTFGTIIFRFAEHLIEVNMSMIMILTYVTIRPEQSTQNLSKHV